LILSRILWLDGLDSGNGNTRERYIYIHGTNQEERIGSPASHGCVRMTNADVIDLFQRLRLGSEVVIEADAPGIVLPGLPKLP
jgi:lipoprotein-anchoring transpeptidase ErfK/SrfK